MSKSRLEKFLYALYSLDSSDLPNPLSRIEELYKCLVTGDETPTFEPLSRVEKYLMAILGVYDVELLPNPLSRVEVLLCKLATGDDNLDDVKSFPSEHEELLAEIIRNRGVGGNIDIEYVLHTLSTEFNTLYNTAEKPIKSAILKGNTMVNIAQITSYNFDNYRTPVQDLNKPLEIGKQYTIIVNIVSQTVKLGFTLRFGKDDSLVGIKTFNGVGLHKFLYNATNDFNQIAPYIDLNEWNEGLRLEYNQLMIIEGDYTKIDVPYFEGMQSVKMPVLTTTGKNLFDMKDIDKDDFELNKYQTAYYGKEFILEPNTKYTIKAYLREDITDTSVWTVFNIINNSSILEVINIDKTGISGANEIKQVTFTTDSTGKVGYSIYSHNQSERSWLGNLPFDIQLEKGSTATSYEPYKSNILTLNEEVKLRGIGDVKDELDLITGELTQRIGEYSLDGSSNNGKWVIRTDVYKEGYIYFQQELNYILQSENIAICNRLPYSNQSHISSEQLRLTMYNNKTIIGVRLSESKGVSSLDEFSEYLKSNPIKFKYPLTTASIKTVDLSTVNQDGNNTELSTFNDITHLTLSSEGLIPEAELEVATKNEEVLNTMSLEMDDISTTQNALKETSNTQSENVDATMIATTEIYEELI